MIVENQVQHAHPQVQAFSDNEKLIRYGIENGFLGLALRPIFTHDLSIALAKQTNWFILPEMDPAEFAMFSTLDNSKVKDYLSDEKKSATNLKGIFSFSFDIEYLNNMFSDCIKSHLNNTKAELSNRFVHRKHLFDSAFRMHQLGEWNASIPLFLAQIDGIFEEIFGMFLFTDANKRKNDLPKKVDDIRGERITVLSELFLQDGYSRIKSGFRSKCSDKNSWTTRAGVMHGHQDFLDYGSQLNSEKCIAMLSYIACSECI